ncbi:MAG: histidine kinase [Flavipsychrobacter sp.]|nr:histidine kinase [Flavipsychrobacter sp.]
MVLPLLVEGQTSRFFNLNAENGLPSNHVYGMITDRFGYLWLATDKGVVRYNGYESKLFDMKDGLPTDDVWELVEDKKGRIWLGCIATETGYLLEGQYSGAYSGLNELVYPMHIRPRDSGICFLLGFKSLDAPIRYCFDRNDSIKTVNIYASKWTHSHLRHGCVPIIDEHGEMFIIVGNDIFSYDVGSNQLQNGRKARFQDGQALPERHFYDNSLTVVDGAVLTYPYQKKSNYVLATNIRTGATIRREFGKAPGNLVQYVYIEKKQDSREAFFVFTEKYVYKCLVSDSIEVVASYYLPEYLSEPSVTGSDLSTFHSASGWGVCIGTSESGAFLESAKAPAINECGIDLKGYNCVGSHNDSLSFWWSDDERKIAILDRSEVVKRIDASELSGVNDIKQYAGDTFFVSGPYPYFLFLQSGKLVRTEIIRFGTSVNAMFRNMNGDIEEVSGFGCMTIREVGGEYKRRVHDYTIYKALKWDGRERQYWAYNNSSILVYDPLDSSRTKTIKRHALNALGVKKLLSVTLDSLNGNVFIAGYDNMLVYDKRNGNAKLLFRNIRFKDGAFVYVKGDILIVAWKYGILFSAIKGKMEVSDPLVYLNVRSLKYKYLNSCVVMGDKLYINTDRGLYNVQIPSSDEVEVLRSRADGMYRLVYLNDGRMSSLNDMDTIRIGDDGRIGLDLVNPIGVGQLTFHYSFDSINWVEIDGGKFIDLPRYFNRDEYYTFYVFASDDSWKSKLYRIQIYPVPKWWQTRVAKTISKVGIVVLVLLIIAGVVYVTRKIVLRATTRKQLQMEMELKSIYAQINPHFIFNSLNSALLLVSKNRMDEAYVHISKFSKLLRSYLRSSRNKYVSIEEEVANLRNYMELQQARFKSRFSCDIEVDQQIDAAGTKIPSLLIQPFVENAINHGILPMDGAGLITVRFLKSHKESSIVCVIDDNGIGREQSRLNNAGAEQVKDSYGDIMIRDLVNIFNKYEKMNIFIEYFDKKVPQTGTTVTITIKNPYHEP